MNDLILPPASGASPEGHPGRAGPRPELDEECYRADLAGLGLTREAEDALLRTLWSITGSFVDLAFGLDPVSLRSENALPACPPSLQLNERNAVRQRFRAVTDQRKEVPE